MLNRSNVCIWLRENKIPSKQIHFEDLLDNRFSQRHEEL